MGEEHDHPQPAPADEQTRRVLRTSTLAILAFWLVVMAALYFGMKTFMAPRGATVTSTGSLVIPRHSDGHFRVAGTVNGVAVNFMVDTGASLIAVTDAVAKKAGLTDGVPTTFRTANGERQGRVSPSQSVTVRNLEVSGLRVGTGYTGESEDDALLGQNFLRQFDLEIKRDSMVLNPR
jgi:aspartyl protease family protein